jgi:hypothetical protein
MTRNTTKLSAPAAAFSANDSTAAVYRTTCMQKDMAKSVMMLMWSRKDLYCFVSSDYTDKGMITRNPCIKSVRHNFAI